MIVLTGILAFATIKLWIATRDLVRGAEKTAERQLRAYLTVGPVEFNPPKAIVGQPLRFRYTIHNSGQTPAYKVAPIIKFGLLAPDFDPRTELPLNPEIGEGTKSRGTLGSRRNFRSYRVRQIEDSAVRAIQRDERRLYLYGTVRYFDVFETEQRTDFCCYIALDGDRWMTRVTEHGNDAT
jgi:hypothetical protein